MKESRKFITSKNIIIIILVMLLSAGALVVSANSGQERGGYSKVNEEVSVHADAINTRELIDEKGLKSVYLAGGCFWGVEAYMSRIAGVYDVVSGYANGRTENPSYENVIYDNTGHAETVWVAYDPEQVSLTELLEKFFKVVDPTSLNKQGNDIGTQYRSGIYYELDEDKAEIDAVIENLRTQYSEEIVVEVTTLQNFYYAEEYHQDYLEKNPNGYCHINLNTANETDGELIDEEDYPSPSEEVIKETLSPLEYSVTRKNSTEPAFSHELNNNYELGIYVDIVTGEPLFLSTDKYDSGTGWPSFTKPISSEVLIENGSNFSIFSGVEIKSRSGENHLGHVFSDGPDSEGGLRYCMNGSSLKFVDYNSMTEEGYGYLKHLLENDDSVSIIK